MTFVERTAEGSAVCAQAGPPEVARLESRIASLLENI